MFHHVYLPSSRVYMDPARPGSDYVISRELIGHGLAEFMHTLLSGSINALWRTYDLGLTIRTGAAWSDGRLEMMKTLFSGRERWKTPAVEVGRPGEAYERVKSFIEAGIGPVDAFVSPERFEKNWEENPRFRRIALHACGAAETAGRLLAGREKLLETIRAVLGDGRKISFTNTSLVVLTENDRPTPWKSLPLHRANAIMLLVAAMSAWEDVLLIDYPEFSIHVDFRMELINLMRVLNPKAQIIMTTQSPAIYGNLERDEVFEVSGFGE